MQLNECKFKKYVEESKCLCLECKGQMAYVNIKQLKEDYWIKGMMLAQILFFLALALHKYLT